MVEGRPFCSACGAKVDDVIRPTNCVGCGADLDDDTVFCSKCGTRVSTETAKAACLSCGEVLPVGTAFCSKCGTKVGAENVEVSAQGSLSKTPAVPPQGAMNCPHCNGQKTVRVEHVKKKKGVSPGKIAAGVVTGGFSLLATGLAKKDEVNQLTCSACGMKWIV